MSNTSNVTVDPNFKLSLLAVFGVMIISLIVNIGLAISFTDLTDTQQQLFEMSKFGYQGGIGAILGLITGKTTST